VQTQRKIDLYIGVGPCEIIFLLWGIFLDAQEFFSHQVKPRDILPESQLRYTTNFIGVGRIPMDIMGVLLQQFGAQHPRGTGTLITADSGATSNNIFRPAEWVTPTNPNVVDGISTVTMPLLEKFPHATAEALMAHSDLQYDDIRIRNKGACLNYNLLGICKDRSCSYRHSKAQPTPERVKAVTDKLKTAVDSFILAGAPANPNKKRKCS
jgi:hypothetical protein